MANRPPRSGTSAEIPTAAPHDLYATSDIRFVMVEIGKLTTQVSRLIEDVGKHGEKIDLVRHQISFVKGAVWVFGALGAIAVAAITIYLKFAAH